MLHDIEQKVLVFFEEGKNGDWFLDDPKAKDLVEIATQRGIKLDFLRNCYKSHELLEDGVFWILRDLRNYEVGFNLQSLLGYKWKLKRPISIALERRLNRNESDQIQHLLFCKATQRQRI